MTGSSFKSGLVPSWFLNVDIEWKFFRHCLKESEGLIRSRPGGLCLFALATLVLDCLTLGYYHELHQCTSIVVTSFPIVQAVFTIIQVSLLSFYAKVCIQEKQSLNRFGLMHTLATNILMWMSVVLDESMKQLEEIYDIQKKKMNLIEKYIPSDMYI
ncbi:proton channel OTOP2-like [Pyxicephalus adspersus]|uniref:proton channel OTOP2-like n=1 Tax=Pyxicephalus adspersus TaxID=30357 RepID=UPI003B5B043F